MRINIHIQHSRRWTHIDINLPSTLLLFPVRLSSVAHRKTSNHKWRRRLHVRRMGTITIFCKAHRWDGSQMEAAMQRRRIFVYMKHRNWVRRRLFLTKGFPENFNVDRSTLASSETWYQKLGVLFPRMMAGFEAFSMRLMKSLHHEFF